MSGLVHLSVRLVLRDEIKQLVGVKLLLVRETMVGERVLEMHSR